MGPPNDINGLLKLNRRRYELDQWRKNEENFGEF